MAAQAHLRRPGGLIDAGIERGAFINAVMRARIHSIPQRRLRRSVVRRMAEDANLRLMHRTNGTGAPGGEIMLGINDRLVGQGRGGEREKRKEKREKGQSRQDDAFSDCHSQFSILWLIAES